MIEIKRGDAVQWLLRERIAAEYRRGAEPGEALQAARRLLRELMIATTQHRQGSVDEAGESDPG